MVMPTAIKKRGRMVSGSVGVSFAPTPITLTKNQPEIMGPTMPSRPAARDSHTSIPLARSQLARQLPQMEAQLAVPTPAPT